MRAEAWSAVAAMMLSGAAIVGGGWAVFTHARTRRTDAARWVTQSFNDLYRDPHLIQARELYEYDYWAHIARVVELRVTDRHVSLTPIERERLRAVDLILNYFEQLLYLEEESHIAQHDREVFFSYWTGIMRYPSRAGLRRYLVNCGYERCAVLAYGSPRRNRLAFAGELFAFPAGRQPADVSVLCDCSLPFGSDESGVAQLEDLNGGQWSICLLKLPQWQALDAKHGYDASDIAASSTRRVCLPLFLRPQDAWFYIRPEAERRLPALLPEAGGGYMGSGS